MSKVIIIGAGPAGLAAAIRLHQHNHLRPIIYELRPEPSTKGGSLGIPANGLRLLHRLDADLYDAVLQHGIPLQEVILYSSTWRTPAVIGRLEFSTTGNESGPEFLRIPRKDLTIDCLLQKVRELQIPIYFGKRLVAIHDDHDGVTVTFADGTTDSAPLLLGCDGIHSAVRTLHVHQGFRPSYSGLSAIAAVVPCVHPTFAAASGGGAVLHATLTQQGMLSSMPCSASQTYWFFTQDVALPHDDDSNSGISTRDGWNLHREEEVGKVRSSMNEALDGLHGEHLDFLRRLVEQTSALQFYPIYRLPLGGKWYRTAGDTDRVSPCLLLGDAAHAMSPHAGQGVSMALEDVFLLSGLLEKHGLTGDALGKVFAEYERIRRPRIDQMATTAARNGNLMKKSTFWVLWMEQWFLWGALWMKQTFGLDILAGDVEYDIEDELK